MSQHNGQQTGGSGIPASARTLYMTDDGKVWVSDEEPQDFVANVEAFLLTTGRFYRSMVDGRADHLSRGLLERVVNVRAIPRVQTANVTELQEVRGRR